MFGYKPELTKRDPNRLRKGTKAWAKLISDSLGRRDLPDVFSENARLLRIQYPCPSKQMAKDLIDAQSIDAGGSDPLIPMYLDNMLETRRIGFADAFQALYDHSRYSNTLIRPLYDFDSTVLQLLLRYVPTLTLPITNLQPKPLLHILCKWLSSLVSLHLTMMQPLDQEALSVCDNLGLIATEILENSLVMKFIDRQSSKTMRSDLLMALSSFISFWTQTETSLSTQTVGRLNDSLTARGILHQTQVPEKEAREVAATLQVQNITDLVPVNNRASLFIILAALHCARPVADDHFLMQALQNKYKIEMQLDMDSLAIDLILVSFDLISSEIKRKDAPDFIASMFILKSWLINKVPGILLTLSASMFPQDHIQFCISQAMSHVDKDVFPSMGSNSKSIVQDLREEFLFACVLHHLLPSAAVENLLGEPALSSPPDPSSKYIKETLIEQICNDTDRFLQLIEEIEKLDGNGGVIALATAETIRLACTKSSPDTTILKPICIALAGKPRATDILLQFVSPSNLLQPLCNTLDAWKYDDETECQPSYEDFSSILLLVIAMSQRYNLSVGDLDIPKDSFVAKYITEGRFAKCPDDLPEEQSKQLSTWIKILFMSDSISDELLSTCKPQDFYLLVPTIFNQIVFALAAKVITMADMHTPIEYLSELFLIPSLVSGIQWMISHGRRRKDLMIILTLLLTILKKSDNVHRIVIGNIVGKQSADFIRGVMNFMAGRLPPDKIKSLEPEFARIASMGEVPRTLLSSFPDLDTIATHRRPGHSFQTVLRTTLGNLMDWASAITLQPSLQPPVYAARLLPVCLAILGAPVVLAILLDELKPHMTLPDTSGPIALDLFAALVCAPMPGSRNAPPDWSFAAPTALRDGSLTLREALRLAADDAADLLLLPRKPADGGLLAAECVVRLHRRVEAQLAYVGEMSAVAAASAAAMQGLSAGVAAGTAGLLPELAGLAVDGTGAAGNGMTGLEFTGDLTGVLGDADFGAMEIDADSSMDLLGGSNRMGMGMMEEDIFADLNGLGNGMGDDGLFDNL